jgi:hypothetical protein
MSQKRLFQLMSAFLLLLVLSLVTAGCGSYTSQAGKYSTEARSEVAGSAYVLEQYGAGEVSGAFVKTSLQEYSMAMKSTTQSLRSLKPPPDVRLRQEQDVQALTRSQHLIQETGQTGVTRQQAPQLARRLKELEEELVKP